MHCLLKKKKWVCIIFVKSLIKNRNGSLGGEVCCLSNIEVSLCICGEITYQTIYWY